MYRPIRLRTLAVAALTLAGLTGFDSLAAKAQAGANPQIAGYGWGQIIATPHYPIVGETATISVTITNAGDAPATNVQVKLSFNDWGVTFMGWQQMGTIQTIPFIAPGGTAVASVTNVFNNRTHTCVEALIVGADENTDPNDDRGQINLEVINSGENFGYDVPVANNGEGNLQVGVRGRLVPGEPQGIPPIPLEVRPPVLNLAPGEVAMVHVEVDFGALPFPLPPGPVLLQVEAVDTADPNNRNNVIFEIHRTTAYALKGQALAALENLAGDMPSKSLRNRVSNAAGHVQGSMDRRFWKPGDDNRLVKNGGPSVFAREDAAVKELDKLMSSDIDLSLKARADEITRMLVDADRIIAQTAITDNGPKPAGVDKFQRGDASRADGDYSGAVRSYESAWKVEEGEK